MANGDIYFFNGHGPLIIKMYDSKIDCVAYREKITLEVVQVETDKRLLFEKLKN